MKIKKFIKKGSRVGQATPKVSGLTLMCIYDSRFPFPKLLRWLCSSFEKKTRSPAQFLFTSYVEGYWGHWFFFKVSRLASNRPQSLPSVLIFRLFLMFLVLLYLRKPLFSLHFESNFADQKKRLKFSWHSSFKWKSFALFNWRLAKQDRKQASLPCIKSHGRVVSILSELHGISSSQLFLYH